MCNQSYTATGIISFVAGDHGLTIEIKIPGVKYLPLSKKELLFDYLLDESIKATNVWFEFGLCDLLH